MSKFSSKQHRPNVASVIRTTPGRAPTYEGGEGFIREPKSELFLLAVANMVGEDTFYERAADRDGRFKRLVTLATNEDADWTNRLIVYMRQILNLRSAPVVAAAHYVHAGGPNGRKLVERVLQRPDEPAELLAFWAREYGKSFPQPVKRGIADALKRLYNERSALRYDGQSRAWRMGDVIELVHPKPVAEWQSALFRYLLDVRHHPEETRIDPELLPVVASNRTLQGVALETRRRVLDPDVLQNAGMSWEALSGWLQGPMDAQAWEAVIPTMGYMALLRNLRNFEQAGVAGPVLDEVAAKLADAQNVANSKQFPFRFYSAYRNLHSERFARALELALEASLTNVPSLRGRTLILIDLSGSMQQPMSDRSAVQWWEIASLFGMALARKAMHADVFGYSNAPMRIDQDQPILRSILLIGERGRSVGMFGGTNTAQSLAATFSGHDRVVIVTDEQRHPGYWPHVGDTPVYTFNVGGYRVAQMQQGEHGSYAFGGLNDQAFKVLSILEEQRQHGWPF